MSSRPDGPAEVILGGHPAALAIDRSGIWIVNDSAVQRVDPATQDVRWIEIGTEPQSVSVGEGSVWVASALGQSLTRIDSANATLVGQPVILRSRPTDIAFGAGSVWLAEPEENALARIDPRTKRSQATITVDRSPSAALVIGQSVWVLLSDHRSLEQVDARSDRVVREVSLQSPPVAATADRDHLWVATAEPEP